MPVKIRIFYTAIVLAMGVLGFFGYKIQNWDSAMSVWLDAETWIITNAANPGLFLLFIAILVGTVILPEAWYFLRRHLEAMEARGVGQHDVIYLPSLTIFELAHYLRKTSAWGWRKYHRLNYWEEGVDHFVCKEIQRAASLGEIRIVGSSHLTGTTWPIDPGYWYNSNIDESRIWDNSNRSQTVPGNGVDTERYFDLRVPKIDVEKSWPRSHILFMLYASVVVKFRKRGLPKTRAEKNNVTR
jgi:hypothetical protein